jgi:hypothetical protein
MKKSKAIKLLMLIAIILGITAIPTFAKAVPSLDEFKVNRRWYCLRRDGYYSNTGLTNAGEITVNGKNIIGNNFNINNKKLTKDQLYKIAYILTEAKENGAKRISANGFSYQQAIWKILGQNISKDKKEDADGNPRRITLNKAADDYKKAVDNGLGSKEIIKDIITDEAILLESGEYGPFYVTYDANIAYKTPKIIIEGGTKKGEKSTTQDGITTVKFNIKPNNSSVTKVKIKVTAEGIRKASFNIYNPNEYNENDSKLTTTGAKFYVANGIQCYYCREDYKAGHPQNVFLCVNTGKLVYIPNGFNVAFYCHACGNTDDNVNIHQSLANNAQGYFHTCSQNDKKTYQVVKYGGDYWSIRTNTEIYHIGARNQAHLMTKCRWIRTGKQPLLESLERKSQINKESKEKEYDLIPPVNLTLDKVNSLDLEGDELYNIPNIPFNIKFEQDGKQIYNKDVTTGKDGKVKIEKVIPNSRNDITVTITEKKDVEGDGYKVLSEPLVITLQCIDGKYWKEKDGAGKLSGGEKYVVNYNINATIGLTVKLENKSIIEKLTLLKTSTVKDGEKVEGAKFKLTLTNIASIKNYQVPTLGATQDVPKTIYVETDKNGNIVLEDIEIADLSKDIVITMEETEAPVGYKKIEGKITVTLKRKGNTYTIHKAEKENTVTDDEFKAGEVTLINHELVLNIKDIPIMNLGGIVWTEKIQTDKEQPEINNQYDGENQDEALAGIKVRLYKDGKKVTETTSSDGNQKATYTDHKGNKVEVDLAKGEYMFTDITAGDDYYVVFEYDGIKYQAMTNSKEQAYMPEKGEKQIRDTKISKETNRDNFNNNTETISGNGKVDESKTNAGWIIKYDLDRDSTPKKAIYKATYKNEEDMKNDIRQCVEGQTYTYLSKTEDWMGTWNTDGTINKFHYAFNINCGLSKRFFDLSLGTDVKDATVTINGNQTTYTYDQILDGKLNEALNRPSSEKKIDYNLYLAYSDYNYRIADYKVPGEGAIKNKYDEEALNKEQIESAKKDSELEVYVTYRIELKNQSTQHDAKVNLVEYHFDEHYQYVSIKNATAEKDPNARVLYITPDEGIEAGRTLLPNIEITFKVLPDKNGNKCVLGEDYLNQAEIVSYTTGGGLVDEDSAPGNAFLEEGKVRYEDDTDEANGIQIKLKTNAERSISGKVFDASNNNGVSDVIVQLIELVEINNKQQYEYIWQETVAGSNTVKTTATSGGRGETYTVENVGQGEYKFTKRIIPGNYIVRFIYGDGRIYEIKGNTLTYNGEDYKSTYVDYDYNAKWYNDTKIGEKYLYDEKNKDISKAVDNEARRLKVMSYAVDVDGTKGKKLDLLDADIEKLSREEKATLEEEVIPSTWMCAETLKIKMPVDTDIKDNTSDTTEVGNGSSPTISNTQFNNVNFGLMERPKTKLVLEKHITGLTVKPVASGVNLIANATADINKILDQGEGDQIQLEGQRDGLSATKSGRTNRGLWYLQTDTTELAQGADAYITYTYVIKNEGEQDYLSAGLIEKYTKDKDGSYKAYLETLEGIVKDKIKSKGFTKGEYLSGSYYRKNDNAFTPTPVQASVEKLQEALNPKVKFVNSTTDFSKTDRNSNIKYAYYDTNGNMQENDSSINEIITSTKGTGKMELNGRDTSKKLVVSVGLSASEIENGGVYDSYIAQVTHYTNAAGRRDQSTPANLSYVHSEDTGITLDKYNEEDEFWAETFRITKPTGEDKITPVQLAIITISAVAVLGVGIILIKKFVLKK